MAEGAAIAGLSSLHATVAAALLATDAQALTLLDELEAMCLGPVSPRLPDPQMIVAAAQVVDRLTEEPRLLHDSLAQTRAEVDSLTGERGLLRDSLAQVQGDVDRLAKERGLLRESLTQAQAEVDRLAEERGLLRENLAQLLAETERLQEAQAAGARQILHDSQAARAESALLNARVAALRRQLEDAQVQHDARAAVSGAQILRLSAELQATRDHVARIHASSSWRVTRPMRAVRRRLGRS